MENPGVMRRTVALMLAMTAVVAALLAVLVAAPAHACSCAVSPLGASVAASESAFVGEVSDVRIVQDGLQISTVQVERANAGRVRKTMEVRHSTGSSMCGVRVGPGDRVLALTYGHRGTELNLDGCATLVDSATTDESSVDAAARKLGPGTPPESGVRALDDGEPAPADGDAPGPWLVAGTVAVSLGVVGLLAWVRRRRSA